LKDVKQSVVNICQYGFTEMLNNVIDHSESPDAIITYEQNYNQIVMMIVDHGIGVFEKIRHDFNLDDPRAALLELSKGKLTSNPAAHSGEGIFFTSRMFDRFIMFSGELSYQRERQEGDDWRIETGNIDSTVGTIVQMHISTDANWTMREVFDRYQGDRDRFRKTHVPIKLGQNPGELLVSRSQAKRILARFDNFSEVLLDFSDVSEIGQGFADEIFRVFRNAHPEIKVIGINMSPAVERMVESVQSAAGR
jgi:anti-sigma regulatory factor (Ser/Thr protein kinase)